MRKLAPGSSASPIGDPGARSSRAQRMSSDALDTELPRQVVARCPRERAAGEKSSHGQLLFLTQLELLEIGSRMVVGYELGGSSGRSRRSNQRKGNREIALEGQTARRCRGGRGRGACRRWDRVRVDPEQRRSADCMRELFRDPEAGIGWREVPPARSADYVEPERAYGTAWPDRGDRRQGSDRSDWSRGDRHSRCNRGHWSEGQHRRDWGDRQHRRDWPVGRNHRDLQDQR
jgi:hypothetical protein